MKTGYCTDIKGHFAVFQVIHILHGIPFLHFFFFKDAVFLPLL